MTRLSLRLLVVLLGLSALFVCPAAADNGDDRTGAGNVANEALPITQIDFLSRRSFSSDKEYGEYIQKTLRIGYRVRACADYQSVTKGMMGTYYGTKPGGTPPCLVVWDKNLNSSSLLLPTVPPGKAAHVYWVFWHQVEIVAAQP
jgi:hypothetical protein